MILDGIFEATKLVLFCFACLPDWSKMR